MISVVIWILGAIVSFGLSLNAEQKCFPTIASVKWTEDFECALLLSLIAWPVSLPACLSTFDREIHSKERVKLGFMFWPPNWHNRMKLIKVLSKD